MCVSVSVCVWLCVSVYDCLFIFVLFSSLFSSFSCAVSRDEQAAGKIDETLALLEFQILEEGRRNNQDLELDSGNNGRFCIIFSLSVYLSVCGSFFVIFLI